MLTGLIWMSQVARSTPFDNSINGLESVDTQSAIEEVYGKPRYSVVTVFNGTVSNNDWLGYDSLIPGDQVPITVPTNCILNEVTVGYRSSILVPIFVDGRLQLFKNGYTDPTDIIYTETFTNQAGGKIISDLNIPFLQGDFIVGRWKDDGANPSDMVIVYFFQIT